MRLGRQREGWALAEALWGARTYCEAGRGAGGAAVRHRAGAAVRRAVQGGASPGCSPARCAD